MLLIVTLLPTSVFAAEGSYTVLAFTSDAHNMSNNTSANRLGTWIDEIVAEYGHLDAMGFCGDMGDAGASSTNFWNFTQNVMDVVSAKGVTGVYTTGNHEYSPGGFDFRNYPYATGTQSAYVINDIGKEGDNYIIYCLGSVSS
ncbi:MAG: hypothetical protein IKD96_02910, partial [Oscillospiraceae bacterium]|nr:hypothetical protein [Oscillospiraceae bacterium]